MLRKLVIFNFVALCLVAAGVFSGSVLPAFAADITRMSYVIAVTLLYGTFLAFKAAWDIDKVPLAKQQILFKPVADIANYLVLMGLIGTAMGVLIALGGATVGTSALDVGTFTSTVLGGVKVAFHSTIVGTFAYMWHHINCRMVHTEIELRGL